MNPVATKVKGATYTAGAGGALTTIALWVATDPQFGFQLTIPAEIAGAVTTLVMSACAFLGGWSTTEKTA